MLRQSHCTRQTDMSPQLASRNAVVTVKSETSYHSPPSSLSDVSQVDNEESRGRRQERARSNTAKIEDDTGDEKANGGDRAGGKQRKRKRSRKGLEKNFPCPHQGCGKSYSRAEHLYRHQLNRKFCPKGRGLLVVLTAIARHAKENLCLRFSGM